MKVLRPNVEKRGGLVDVVVQCGITHQNLMKGKTDLAGYLNTLKTGLATFYSESRQKPWLKGEESGNVQTVIDVHIDCDGDALLYIVVQQGKGVACHTGARTCFYRSVLRRDLRIPAPKAGEKEALEEIEAEVHPDLLRIAKVDVPAWNLHILEDYLRQRAKASPEDSYTRRLLNNGPAKCAKKFGEEATEAVIAAVSESDERIVAECADVLYHLLVLLLSRGLSLDLVEEELLQRREKSGLQEKASRQS